ncbi:carboxypeptidase-like regulatory domain-containing protein [Proteiniclasticum sp.]|uniref:carboxypeptidase-like regulatory domain-containing protein n=1 Tax=Proteiniclasticum sp. TaxID=2053595 RepID=UPI0028993C97|nr:carboxypeptidase-like regulatory domain-containing protein [Proteiniclasticum sp.]
MGKINGIVSDYEGNILADAEVLFVDRNFNVLGSGYTNEDGEYYLQINEKTNGSVIGTYSYGEKYLAFTHANISTNIPHRINVTLGNIEFIHFSRELPVNREVYTATFQLVSLGKMKRGENHLSPEKDEHSFKALLDGKLIDEFEITQMVAEVEEKNATIDQYRLSFKSGKDDRGKVLSLVYSKDNEYGILKSFL